MCLAAQWQTDMHIQQNDRPTDRATDWLTNQRTEQQTDSLDRETEQQKKRHIYSSYYSGTSI